MPTSIELLDAAIPQYLELIKNTQAANRKTNGRFIQSLRSHVSNPSWEVKLPPDAWENKPTNEKKSLKDVVTEKNLPVPQAWGASIQVDTYKDRADFGYYITFFTKFDSDGIERRKTYKYSIKFDTTDLIQDWVELN